jgi:hypothetical protein
MGERLTCVGKGGNWPSGAPRARLAAARGTWRQLDNAQPPPYSESGARGDEPMREIPLSDIQTLVGQEIGVSD